MSVVPLQWPGHRRGGSSVAQVDGATAHWAQTTGQTGSLQYLIIGAANNLEEIHLYVINYGKYSF